MANVLLHTDVKTDAKTNLNVLMRKICDLMGQKTSPGFLQCRGVEGQV